MGIDERVGAIMAPGQLVGMTAPQVNSDFLAQVTKVISDDKYELTVRKLGEKGYNRDYDKLMDISTCTVFKGMNQLNNSLLCDVESVADNGNDIIIVAKIASNVNQAQLRKFVRLIISLPAKVTGDDADTDFFGPTLMTQTVDLSGGGMRFICSGNYSINGEVYLELLYGLGTAVIKGIVLRKTQIRGSQYEYAVAFSQIDEKNKKYLSDFCEEASRSD